MAPGAALVVAGFVIQLEGLGLDFVINALLSGIRLGSMCSGS
jgi:hypothetical protein